MRKILPFILFLIPFLTQAQVHHELLVTIDPSLSTIEVSDEITLQKGLEITFELNSALTPKPVSKGLSLHKMTTSRAGDVGMDRQEDAVLSTTKWRITWMDRYPNSKTFTIAYSGKIESALEQSDKNYQRGFSESPGIISEKGIYLAGSTFWVPVIGSEMMTYSMDVLLPKGWKSVSQGARTISNEQIERWTCDKPQEEVFLIGAKFTEYSFDAGNVKAMAFLRTPDDGIANKYLETTAQYLEMYRGVLGVYPYSKFALVENFWETGYGMPSFTLLGERIIRFPFILHSSYPHELLHNWWGNSVYVDFEKGNWCEGLTAYMADHLIKEQRGKGMEYRRSTLQKYTDLVNTENDFPLVDFRSRHDGASEAIGYGKSLMMWHMLRQKFGDEKFLQAMRKFYKNNKFKRASFNDIKKAFEQITEEDLANFFTQWTTRKGAPELTLGKTSSEKLANGHYNFTFTLQQKQKEDAFILDVPIVIAYKNSNSNGTKELVEKMTKKIQQFTVELEGMATGIHIDPMFDLFRKLDPKEVPPALTKAYGATKTLIIKPKGAKSKVYDTFVKSWIKEEPSKFEVKYDDEIKALPDDRTIWILGYENRFSTKADMGIFGGAMTEENIIFPSGPVGKGGKEVVFTLPHPNNEQETIVFVAIDNEAAIPGFVRKIPHYGKYGYLAFEGTEPTNVAKGQWPVLQSPLKKILVPNSSGVELKKREALAYLQPVFSSKNMMDHINYLASAKLKGRGLGTPELDEAADYIADAFAQAGLKTGSDNSYFQTWTADVKDKKKVKLKNVIGMIPGTDPKFKDAPIVISAHYDHLGMGWPDAHKGDQGKIHFGADDNASGVAVMLELALRMGKTTKPIRPIIFIAFTGEEAGLVGSRYFVQSSGYGSAFANINLDTEGSLFENKLIILNANTASEWKHIFMGTDYVTGIATQLVMKQLDASDQGAFIEKGIPAIQFFAGATTNYHRPSDTPENIDAAGLVKVATVAKEVLVYLADRERPMPFTGEINSKKKPNREEGTAEKPLTWRASTGSVPSFSYEGKGVKIGSVPKGSPAEKAGLLAGDIIIKMAGEEVEDLVAYTHLLKRLKPGQTVSVTVLRDGKEVVSDITLKAR